MKKFLLLAALLAAGCSADKQAEPAAEKAELHLLIWSEYLDQSLIEEFEKEANAVVVVDNFDSSEALRAKIDHVPSGFDVVVPSDEILPDLVADGKLEKLDMTKLPNFKNIGAGFRGLSYDPNNEYSVPFHWGATGIAYDVKKLATPPNSWATLFDARSSAAGTILDDPREVFAAALRLDGAALDTLTPDQLAKAKKRILGAKPKAWDSQPQKMLIQGDIAIAQMYNGDVAQVADERGDIAFVIPKEGGTLWFDNLSIAKGSTQVELAHKFLDFIMRPEVAGKNTNFKKYPSPNEAAKPFIDKAILENTMIYPTEADLMRCTTLGTMKSEAKKLMLEAWAEVRGN